ncbi:MAG: Bifunctional protein HldE [Legionellaceae bacterium]
MHLQIPNYQNARVLIMGDVMLDRYWHGSTTRVSPEAPVPVVHIQQEENRPGGAGNVALNIATLGAHVSLLGMIGDDEAGSVLEQKLRDANIDCHFEKLKELPTITKLRILSQHQQLIRLDFEETNLTQLPLHLPLEYSSILSQAHILVLSDYAKGTLRNIPEIIKQAKIMNIPVIVDPKGTDFTKYDGATLLTPNKKEFEAIVGPCLTEKELIEKAHELIHSLNLKALLVTQGEKGMTLIELDKPGFHLPACQHEVYDVTGAGDTVIATLAASLAAGETLVNAVKLANIAAGISVSKLGTTSVNLSELRRNIWQTNIFEDCIMTEEQLLIAIQDAKAHGECIVMTNGCFDILHAGHVTYLDQAKRLGDRLIVAINTDESIRQLKGNERPINSLSHRMTVLAGLNAVDWVIPFNENTPERLLALIKPDILVKGGDYTIKEVIGHEIVFEYGGEVNVLKHIEGCSTTRIIEKMKNNSID